MIHHSVLVLALALLVGTGICHGVARTVIAAADLPDVTRLLLPVVGISLLALELLIFGLVHVSWTPITVLLPPAAIAVIRHRALGRALASDAGRAWTGMRALAAGGPVAIVLALALLTLFAAGLVQAVAAPLDAWDAVAVWMLKAKVFFVEQSFSLTPLLHDSDRRLDYPPLFPGWVAVIYALGGGVHDAIGKAIDGLLLPLVTLSIVVTVRALAGLLTALLLGLVVAASPILFPFVFCACQLGYADFAMGALAASALAHLALAEDGNGAAAPGALLAAALAALVKNEGIVLMVATVGALAVLPAGRAAARAPRAWIPAVAAVAGVAAWQVYLRLNGLRPDYLGSAGGSPGSILDRTGTVLRYAGSMIAGSRDYQLVAIAAVLALLFVLAGDRRRWTVLVVVAIQLASYVAAFVVTPYPIQWQLGTSADRLVAQVVPGIVLALGIGLGALGSTPTQTGWARATARAGATPPGGAGPRGWLRRGPRRRGRAPRG